MDFDSHNRLFWILIGKYSQSSESWIFYYGFNDLDNEALYIPSLYWTATTLITVGYGHINVTNQGKQIFEIVLMIVGTLSYSFTISSIITFLGLRHQKALFIRN